jgi:hypothetical protein
LNSKTLQREYKTIQEMITLACRKRHATKSRELCPSCTELLVYVKTRLDKCPYQEQKPSCARCPIHCYKTVMRENIRNVMRYSGPRMLRRHPILAIRHLLDGFKTRPRPPRG